MNPRFTLDGSDALEEHLAQTCQRVLTMVRRLAPPPAFEALVLGGGYGRGQGGVCKSGLGDRPYNDLEFYVFLRGNVWLNQLRYQEAFHELGDQLSAAAGVHVEFKTASLARLRKEPVSMFSYDLVAGHRVIFGEGVFRDCEHHLRAEAIPLHEATRLLFNRCSGLLLVKDILRRESLTAEQSDFIGRNLAKAQLAFGDAVLTVFGGYHWNCLKRGRRLNQLSQVEELPWLAEVQKHHAQGIDFKLHPYFTSSSKAELEPRCSEVADLGKRMWLWLESRRLGHRFASPRDYAFGRLSKCPQAFFWRNALLNLRTFGPRAIVGLRAFRYPRERLLNALSLLLWDDNALAEENSRRCLQDNLLAKRGDWPELLGAYRRAWPVYG